MFVSDEGEVIAVYDHKNIIMYKHKNYYSLIEGKIGMKPNSNEFNELKDVNYCMKNGGVALYTRTEVYFLRASTLLNIPPSLIKLNVNIPKGETYIHNVHACIDPTLVVIELKSLYRRHLFIVWNIETDKDVSNFSSAEECVFANGVGSKAGYLMFNDYYFDLDNNIIDPYFKLQEIDWHQSKKGCWQVMSKGTN